MEKKVSHGIVDKEGRFSIKIQSKNPKPNPVTHRLVTVQDIFNAINEKNINKFMREFKQGMKVGIASRNLLSAISKSKGMIGGEKLLQMEAFNWIED